MRADGGRPRVPAGIRGGIVERAALAWPRAGAGAARSPSSTGMPGRGVAIARRAHGAPARRGSRSCPARRASRGRPRRVRRRTLVVEHRRRALRLALGERRHRLDSDSPVRADRGLARQRSGRSSDRRRAAAAGVHRLAPAAGERVVARRRLARRGAREDRRTADRVSGHGRVSACCFCGAGGQAPATPCRLVRGSDVVTALGGDARTLYVGVEPIALRWPGSLPASTPARSDGEAGLPAARASRMASTGPVVSDARARRDARARLHDALLTPLRASHSSPPVSQPTRQYGASSAAARSSSTSSSDEAVPPNQSAATVSPR